MGRWTQYDEDDYRLPEGMKRVGYDSDNGKYYYRDRDGLLWEGMAGSQYGELRQVESTSAAAPEDNDDLEAAPARADGYQPLATDGLVSGNGQAYRTLFPFLMMTIVVILLVLRLAAPTQPTEDPVLETCTEYARAYRVKAGDTCWEIATSRGFTVEKLVQANPGLDCQKLTPSQILCLPGERSTTGRARAARRRMSQ